MFAHPWCADEAAGAEPPAKKQKKRAGGGAQAGSAAMGGLNKTLRKRAKKLLARSGTTGPADFNLSLINRMEPMDSKHDLKEESAFGMGKVSVSWHADSSLVDSSTIAVLVAQHDGSGFGAAAGAAPAESATPWRIALRVVRDIEGPGARSKAKAGGGREGKARPAAGGDAKSTSNRPDDDEVTPAIAAPLQHGDSYYMLGNFNHHHQHAVLAGTQCWRFSSTHRVVTEEHTLEHIAARCRQVLIT
jgi:alpha-ketoglutarate-dependent dioxygenase FTO